MLISAVIFSSLIDSHTLLHIFSVLVTMKIQRFSHATHAIIVRSVIVPNFSSVMTIFLLAHNTLYRTMHRCWWHLNKDFLKLYWKPPPKSYENRKRISNNKQIMCNSNPPQPSSDLYWIQRKCYIFYNTFYVLFTSIPTICFSNWVEIGKATFWWAWNKCFETSALRALILLIWAHFYHMNSSNHFCSKQTVSGRSVSNYCRHIFTHKWISEAHNWFGYCFFFRSKSSHMA